MVCLADKLGGRGSISEIRKGIRENQQQLQNLATSARELKSKILEPTVAKISVAYRESAEFDDDESDSDEESRSDSEEPPAKRRSLSPEDDSLPEVGRTRSGRIYQPAMTEANSEGRREVTLPPPFTEHSPRSTASKNPPLPTLDEAIPQPTQQAPVGFYAAINTEKRYLKNSKAKSSQRERTNKNKPPTLSIRSDALGLGPYYFDYATPPPSSGFIPVSTNYFGSGDYRSWQAECSLSSNTTVDVGPTPREPSTVVCNQEPPQGSKTPSCVPTKTEIQDHVLSPMASEISSIDKRNHEEPRHLSEILGESEPNEMSQAGTKSSKSPDSGVQAERSMKKPLASRKSKPPPIYSPKTIEATEADARNHGIPPGYSLKNWNPTEEPILLLGSVFDASSLGKWIYDWTVYHKGLGTPLSQKADELWLLLTQLARKVKSAKEVMPQIRVNENRELVDDFIESAERLTDRLKKLLKTCEQPMLKAGKGMEKSKQRINAGTEFVEMLFGTERMLEATEKFISGLRLWNLRFDANCESILRKPYE